MGLTGSKVILIGAIKRSLTYAYPQGLLLHCQVIRFLSEEGLPPREMSEIDAPIDPLDSKACAGG